MQIRINPQRMTIPVIRGTLVIFALSGMLLCPLTCAGQTALLAGLHTGARGCCGLPVNDAADQKSDLPSAITATNDEISPAFDSAACCQERLMAACSGASPEDGAPDEPQEEGCDCFCSRGAVEPARVADSTFSLSAEWCIESFSLDSDPVLVADRVEFASLSGAMATLSGSALRYAISSLLL